MYISQKFNSGFLPVTFQLHFSNHNLNFTGISRKTNCLVVVLNSVSPVQINDDIASDSQPFDDFVPLGLPELSTRITSCCASI